MQGDAPVRAISRRLKLSDGAVGEPRDDRVCLIFQKVLAESDGDCFGAVAGVDLREDGRDELFDARLANAELKCDFPVREAARNRIENF